MSTLPDQMKHKIRTDKDSNTCKIVNVKGILIKCDSLMYTKFNCIAMTKLSCSGRKLSLVTGVAGGPTAHSTRLTLSLGPASG